MNDIFSQFLVSPTNVPATLEERLREAIDTIADLYDDIARESGVDSRGLSFRRPIYMFVVKTGSRIFVLYTNEQAVRGQTRWWFLDSAGYAEPSDNELISITKRDIGLNDWKIFEFDLGILRVEDEIAFRERLKGVAAIVYRSDLSEEFRRKRIVQINPVFSGRDFIVNQNLCFILMPFREELNPVYEDHIKKVAQEINLVPRRADDIFRNTAIIEDIWESINQARILIADLTGKNPNVFYEVGVAHTVGKDVILITQNIDDVPFDLRHLRHIQYQYTPRGMEIFEQQLRNTLLNILNH